MRRKFYAAAAPAVAIMIGGCVSAPPPIAELSRAHTLVAQAEQSDAPRYDSADLAAAQESLQQADQRFEGSRLRPQLAMRLAHEAASVDAELTLARTRANRGAGCAQPSEC